VEFAEGHSEQLQALTLLAQIDPTDMSNELRSGTLDFLRNLWQDETLVDELVRLVVIVVTKLSNCNEFREDLLDTELIAFCLSSLDIANFDLSSRIVQILENFKQTNEEDLRNCFLQPECKNVLSSVRNRSCANEVIREIGFFDVVQLVTIK